MKRLEAGTTSTGHKEPRPWKISRRRGVNPLRSIQAGLNSPDPKVRWATRVGVALKGSLVLVGGALGVAGCDIADDVSVDIDPSSVTGAPDGDTGVPGPDQAPGLYNPSPDCTNADGTGAFDIVRETVAQGNIPTQPQIDAAQKCSDGYPGHFESITNPNDVHEIIVYGRPPH